MSIINSSTKRAALGLVATFGAAAAFSSVAAYAGPLGGAIPSLAQPLGPGVQSVGGAVTAVGHLHAVVAPTVVGTAPAVEPFADSVTRGLIGVGTGISATGSAIGSGGLTVTPIAGAKTGVQTLQSGQLVQVHAGPLHLGNSPTPAVSVGTLTSAPAQGSLATAGVANANALLNVNAAPQ